MDKNLLKYLAFVKTVDTGSFTKAADSLNYAQSSISKMIADLEKGWGFRYCSGIKGCLSDFFRQTDPAICKKNSKRFRGNTAKGE